MEASTPKLKILIIGGGIAGLALGASLLHHPHLDFHIYESVPGYKDVGAGLAFHLNAIKAMRLLGPEILQVYFDKALNMAEEEDEELATEVILAQGPHSGTLVAELGRAKGRKTVSRADLLNGLLALLPEEKISFGKRLSEVEETESGVVRVNFQDGSTAEGDCLIGADGVHSLTRTYVLGAEHPATPPQNHDGWQIYRTMIPMTEALNRHGLNPRWSKVVPILLGPHGHINTMPLNKGARLSAGVAVRRGADGSLQGSIASPKLDPELYNDYSEDARAIVSMVAKDPSASWTAADHDHAPTYCRGRMCMIGDAAHASLPFAGNGAAQALEDCAVLKHLFTTAIRSSRDIDTAFKAFDEVRRPRSQAVVELARKFGRVYAYAEEDLRDDPEKMRAFFRQAAAFTNDFDLEEQNANATKAFRRFRDGVV